MPTSFARIVAYPFAAGFVRLDSLCHEIRAQRMLEKFGKRGSNVTIRRHVLVVHPDGVDVGNNVMINHNCHINGGGGIEIGDDVVIGPGTMILTTHHRGSRFFGNSVHSPVRIGSNVWIGANVVVNPGSVIGDNVIIGSGSVVAGEIRSGSIAAGVPAKVLKPLQLPFEPSIAYT